MGKKAESDFSSFMCVILMLIGVLMIMLISNVLTIISNPENVKIGAVIKNALYSDEKDGDVIVPKFANKEKDPTYLDVYQNRMVIFPEQTIVQGGDLTVPGNPFEKLLDRIEPEKEKKYIVLLARPRSATMIRRLRSAIKDRGIGVGFELFEAERMVEVTRPD